MTPKEKAEELVENFYRPIDYNLVGLFSVKNTVAKKCALIAVDEILEVIQTNIKGRYWEEVKQEILAV
jgi:hypothetical protein